MDQLFKHQLDSQLNGKEALDLAEKIILSNNQIMTEVYILFSAAKDAETEINIVEGIRDDLIIITRYAQYLSDHKEEEGDDCESPCFGRYNRITGY
jgi:hypothetical protein